MITRKSQGWKPPAVRPNPQLAAAVEKLKQSRHVSRDQIRTILEITKGDIVDLKVGYRPGTTTIWIVYHGKRYDLDKHGKISREENLGGRNPINNNNMNKKLKCPLCGAENTVPQHEIRIKCSSCGFPLRRVRVKIK